MSEVGRKVLRNSLNTIANGCFSSTVLTTIFNTITLTGEIISDDSGLSRKEVLRECGKGAVVPSVLLTMGVAFKGISRLV